MLGKLKESIQDQELRYQEDGGVFASHMAEAAGMEADRESSYHLVDAEGRTVQEISEALRRIDEGNYGDCEWCGEPIERRRLDAIPYARFCLRCQEKSEKLARN